MDGEAEEDYVESLSAVKSPTGRIPPLKVPLMVVRYLWKYTLVHLDLSCLRVCLEAFGLKGSYKPLVLSCVLTQKSHFL